MASTTSLDEQLVEMFGGELIGHYPSGMVTMWVDIGHRNGLFEAAAEGPATSEELADRAGLNERYVREWLGSLVSAGIFSYSPRTNLYTLPPEHAACLTGPGSANLATVAQINTHLGTHLHQVATAFREGGGVPYSEFRPEFTDVMDSLSRGTYDELLVDAWLPLVPGLTERLNQGIRVADVGCGTGHAIVTMAAAFPASTFVGYDIAEDALERGRAEAAERGLTNAHFEAQDAADLVPGTPFDLITSIDAIHDQVDPVGAVRSIFGALVPGGTYVMVEPAASSKLEDNVSNPFAPWIYGVSTLHCLTVSLAHGGAGLGTAWGEQRAREMLADAGFGAVTTYETPGDPLDTMFVTTKPGA